MRFLYYVNLIALFCFLGCQKKTTTVLKTDEKTIPTPQKITVLWKKSTDTSFQFITKAVVYGKEIKGILFLKKESDSLYKTSFLAQGALKLFEMDLLPDTFIVHKRAKQIDKHVVLKALADDLRLITFELHKTLYPVSVFKEPLITTLRVPYQKTDLYYLFDPNTSNLKELVRTNSDKGRSITILFNNYQQGVPQNINLKHHKFRLQIDLTLLKSE